MAVLEHPWLPPPADLALSSDDVHVWRATLDEPATRVQQLAQTLSDDERIRAGRFHFEKDRRRFVIGQGRLRAILSYYLSIDPSHLQFRYGHRGKPALVQTFGGEKLCFNMSRSYELALYAVTCGRAIGVDLERIRPISNAEQIVEQLFSDQEKAMFRALPPSQKLEAFFNCWTRKEAYLKAAGDGLARPLEQFSVPLTPGEPAELLYLEGDAQEASRWSLRALVPVSGYVAAVVVEGRTWRLACWEWPEQ